MGERYEPMPDGEVAGRDWRWNPSRQTRYRIVLGGGALALACCFVGAVSDSLVLFAAPIIFVVFLVFFRLVTTGGMRTGRAGRDIGDSGSDPGDWSSDGWDSGSPDSSSPDSSSSDSDSSGSDSHSSH